MLKKMLYRKIAVATSILLVMLMLYLIPSNKGNYDLKAKSTLEYIYPNDLTPVYLLDEYNHLTRTTISINNDNNTKRTKEIIASLTKNSKYKELIPEGFKQILPPGTKLLNISFKDKILTIDFSNEFYNIKKEEEKHVIESLIYSLTSIDDIEGLEIYIEGEKLTKLPHSKEVLPNILDRHYGINKEYAFTSYNDIDSYTVYYVFNYNDETYYTPVTKYVNSKEQDKVKIIIDELSSSVFCEGNLISYLDNTVKLLNYEQNEKTIKLNFNDSILSDITNGEILEEVMYTIGLSLCDELDIDTVIFMANNKIISTFYEKKLD